MYDEARKRAIRVGLARGCEITSDGRTVWINSRDGWCIARFGPKGIDIHEEPFSEGKHCLLCEAKWTDRTDWDRFVNAMHDLYGVMVTERYLPKFLRRIGD